jgi:hypothetical protein
LSDIIKTWPANVNAKSVAEMFSEKTPPWCVFYFTLGRGRPKEKVERLWFTYQGRILGHFTIREIVVNDGTLPKLHSLDGSESDWQFRKDAKVAICEPPCVRLRERVFMSGFRGWRYFNFAEYSQTSEARHRL